MESWSRGAVDPPQAAPRMPVAEQGYLTACKAHARQASSNTASNLCNGTQWRHAGQWALGQMSATSAGSCGGTPSHRLPLPALDEAQWQFYSSEQAPWPGMVSGRNAATSKGCRSEACSAINCKGDTGAWGNEWRSTQLGPRRSPAG